MRYLDRRVTVHLWVVHVVIFGYTFAVVNHLLDDPGTTLLAGVIAAVPVGVVVLMQRRRAHSTPLVTFADDAFPVVAVGTCTVCKRSNVGLRETKDGRNDVCADTDACAAALVDAMRSP